MGGVLVIQQFDTATLRTYGGFHCAGSSEVLCSLPSTRSRHYGTTEIREKIVSFPRPVGPGVVLVNTTMPIVSVILDPAFFLPSRRSDQQHPKDEETGRLCYLQGKEEILLITKQNKVSPPASSACPFIFLFKTLETISPVALRPGRASWRHVVCKSVPVSPSR